MWLVPSLRTLRALLDQGTIADNRGMSCLPAPLGATRVVETRDARPVRLKPDPTRASS